MIEQVDVARVLFLDIETVSEQPSFDDLNEDFQELWHIKSRQLLKRSDDLEEEELAAYYGQKAAIYAEFGKIACISVGIVVRDPADKKLKVRLKSFVGEEESLILQDFSQLLEQHYNDPLKFYMCGHNIREFDIPYICRRMVVNQLPLPAMLDLAGKKPWETKHLIDTMELWKFGDSKSYTSLKLLAAVLGFPSPKDDIDGSDVGRVYWEDNDLDRLSLYCEKDVLATVQLLLRFKRMPLLQQEQIVHIRG